jgi:hypothetical protein
LGKGPATSQALPKKEGRRFAETLAFEPREPGERQLASIRDFRRLIQQ